MHNAEATSDDLINFNVKSPSPVPNSSRHGTVFCISDNLLDTELIELEQKLQSSSNLPIASHSRKPSVDIEDILISIDDSYEPSAPPEEDDESFSEEVALSKTSSDGDSDSIVSHGKSPLGEDIEAIRILDTLDDILNAHIHEASENNISANGCDCIDGVTQQSIEECLSELDNYLRELDSSYDSDNEVLEEGGDSVHCADDIVSNNSSNAFRSDSRASLRSKLRRIEENYAKYVSTGWTNKGYLIGDEKVTPLKSRSLSACCKRNETWIRARSHLSTALATLPNRRKRRPGLLGSDLIERSNVSCSDRELETKASNVQSERLAHASGDRCTGTVVVETQTRAPNRRSSYTDADGVEVVAMEDEHVPKSGSSDRQVVSWLRSSMRHLRHLRLPSAGSSDAVRTNREGTISEAPTVEQTTLPATAPPTSGRPFSAPSRLSRSVVSGVQDERVRSQSQTSRTSAVSLEPGGRGGRSSSASSTSRRQRSLSSSETSLASSVDTVGTSPSAHGHQISQPTVADTRRPCERPRANDMPEAASPLGQWPHSLSSTLACLSCTLGLFNISRFAMLTVHFGCNFVFQFIILSVLFGLPLYTLQMCLGQQLGAGVIDMWRISPLFQGVGVSLFLSQALIGVYSIIGISWMFVFFRDSFIARMDRYKWAEPFSYYRSGHYAVFNSTQKLHETVPDYFNGVVLQRHHLSSGTEYGTIKFQLAFNLAVVWMIVFVSLSKGLRSYGKVIYVFTLVPVFGMFILCSKILGLMPPNFIHNIFPETSWEEFFTNSRSWLAAAQETFLTWGLLGAAVMQITSHNKEKHLLQRDSSLVAVITFIILLLVAFLANTCVQILKAGGYYYVPSSFERMNSYIFLRPQTEPLPTSLGNTPIRYMVHNSFILGEKVVRPFMDPTVESGYQVLRLATELIPATFAVLGSEKISSFWAVLFYFILILFGIAQQLAIWHSVITGIMAIKASVLKSWETTITFFSCSFGFLLGLPMATELGIYVVYVLDYTIGGIWWLLTIIFLQIVAVFMVRGRPYSGDNIVTALFNSTGQSLFTSWIPPLLSFIWNVVLPVGLVVLCISTFKNGHFKEMFIWHHAPVAEYWPLIVRQIGSMLQLLPVLCVPVVAVIQSYRYLNNGPSDILEVSTSP
ncbi:hypothetical protein WA026_005390 [Henosepilachna vigintioctopunctata]|uniref:Uncharacterized protein n=1 Tax=Henosepilachna vigintioctopunctata TaxID=420089 RepID=A0AAW1TW88_9CUCU